MIFFLVAPLAIIGLLRGGLVKVWDCCVVGNCCRNAWRLHAQALLLLVLPRKSTMSSDSSTSEDHLGVLLNVVRLDYISLAA